MKRLGVNIDHIATLRNARGELHPDPFHAAKFVKKYGADVVYFEHSSNITRNYLLRDGRLVATVIYGRLIEKHQPIILSPTHNYPILGGIDDIVLAKGIIGVNGHESKDNFFTRMSFAGKHHTVLLKSNGHAVAFGGNS